jgi:hypothetical protein
MGEFMQCMYSRLRGNDGLGVGGFVSVFAAPENPTTPETVIAFVRQ